MNGFKNKEEIKLSKKCGCFFCLYIFNPSEIEDWCDKGETALCPKCGIDSVLGDYSEEITKGHLIEIHKKRFNLLKNDHLL